MACVGWAKMNGSSTACLPYCISFIFIYKQTVFCSHMQLHCICIQKRVDSLQCSIINGYIKHICAQISKHTHCTLRHLCWPSLWSFPFWLPIVAPPSCVCNTELFYVLERLPFCTPPRLFLSTAVTQFARLCKINIWRVNEWKKAHKGVHNYFKGTLCRTLLYCKLYCLSSTALRACSRDISLSLLFLILKHMQGK